MGRITCTRRLEWDALHRIPDHSGACRAFHGHRYSAEITCSGTVNDDGMLIDFGIIKSLVGEWIDSHWDHTAILMRTDDDPAIPALVQSNAKYGKPVYFMDKAPTAENIAEELARQSEKLLAPHNVKVEKVRVNETPNCFADWFSD